MSTSEDQVIQEMICAFAIGCMDKANFLQFKDFLTEGGELPKGDLGELQNIVSMIPIVLELETPDHTIKDKVAKKLIGMKDEIKTKIQEDKKRITRPLAKTTWINPKATSHTEIQSTPAPKPKEETFASKKIPTSTSAYQFGEVDLPKNVSVEKPKQSQAPLPILQPEEPKRMEQIPKADLSKPLFAPQDSEKPQVIKQERGSSGAAGWIAILLTIILFSLVGYYTFTTTESLRKQVDDVKNDITELKSQIATSNNFVNNYTSLIEFFNNKDIVVYNLAGATATEKASAQLLLSFSAKEGLVQFKNSKPLKSNECYQVWAISKGQPYSVGFYQPAGSEYIKISAFPFLPKEKIESFKITIEASAGSQSPSANVYLVSSRAGSNLR